MTETLVILSILIIAGAWIEFYYKAYYIPHEPQTLETTDENK